MTYRDDREALRDRADALERELAEARGTIARLTGRGDDVSAAKVAERSTLLGAPSVVVLDRRYHREASVADAGPTNGARGAAKFSSYECER